MQRGGGDRDETAHAVADDDRRAGDAARPGHRQHLVDPLLERVAVAVVAVAVPGQVDGHDAELVGEAGRDVGPPVGVGAAAVDEHEARAPGLAPGQVVDAGPVDVDPAVLTGDREGAAEPVRGGDGGDGRRRGHAVMIEILPDTSRTA